MKWRGKLVLLHFVPSVTVGLGSLNLMNINVKKHAALTSISLECLGAFVNMARSYASSSLTNS